MALWAILLHPAGPCLVYGAILHPFSRKRVYFTVLARIHPFGTLLTGTYTLIPSCTARRLLEQFCTQCISLRNWMEARGED